MDLTEICSQVSRFGYARLTNLFSHNEVDEFRKDLHNARVEMNDTFSPDLSGRITYIHTKIPKTLEMLLSKNVISCLKALLNDDPVLCQAAVYRFGSEYTDHFDRYFYPTDDVKKEITLWVALEDVKPESGPFYVIPGSHNWPAATSDSLSEKYPEWQRYVEILNDPEADSQKVRDAISAGIDFMSHRFTGIIKEKKSERIPLILKKGDAVIWQSNLVHGGFRRLDRDLTRECLVGNYIAKSSKLWTTKQFFQHKTNELTAENARKIQPFSFNGAYYLVDGEATLGH